MLTRNDNRREEGAVRFSSAFLVAQWGSENNPEYGTGRATGKTLREKAEKQNKIAKRDGGRTYKGISGRISKDGTQGYWDVDSRGRRICV
jgi:hypothetical protein